MANEPSPQGPPDTGAPPASPHLLIVIDASPLGQHTAEIGVAIAAAMRARAVFHVAIPIEHLEASSSTEFIAAASARQAESRQRAKPVFDAAAVVAAKAGVAWETVLTVDEPPLDAVRRVAAEHRCQLIVAGSHGRGGLARMIHGSLVDALVKLSTCPVVVCREDTVFAPAAPSVESPKRADHAD